jgi:hypothetical protein
MENIQAPQNGIVQESELPSFDYTPVTQTHEKVMFPTLFRSYTFSDWDKIAQTLMDLSDSTNATEANAYIDVMKLDHPAVNRLKEVIYEICDTLPLFSGENQRPPLIVGANTLFQQKFEHVPLHCYEFTPLVFTFVANASQNSPVTYFADTRGGVQTVDKHIVSQNLIGTGYGVKGNIGEIFVTPGYVQRYTETNLDEQTYVTINVMVSFANY